MFFASQKKCEFLILGLWTFFIVGVEARGFIFASPIALAIGAKFVPLRKPRNLPGKIPVSFSFYITIHGLVVMQVAIWWIMAKFTMVNANLKVDLFKFVILAIGIVAKYRKMLILLG